MSSTSAPATATGDPGTSNNDVTANQDGQVAAAEEDNSFIQLEQDEMPEAGNFSPECIASLRNMQAKLGPGPLSKEEQKQNYVHASLEVLRTAALLTGNNFHAAATPVSTAFVKNYKLAEKDFKLPPYENKGDDIMPQFIGVVHQQCGAAEDWLKEQHDAQNTGIPYTPGPDFKSQVEPLLAVIMKHFLKFWHCNPNLSREDAHNEGLRQLKEKWPQRSVKKNSKGHTPKMMIDAQLNALEVDHYVKKLKEMETEEIAVDVPDTSKNSRKAKKKKVKKLRFHEDDNDNAQEVIVKLLKAMKHKWKRSDYPLDFLPALQDCIKQPGGDRNLKAKLNVFLAKYVPNETKEYKDKLAEMERKAAEKAEREKIKKEKAAEKKEAAESKKKQRLELLDQAMEEVKASTGNRNDGRPMIQPRTILQAPGDPDDDALDDAVAQPAAEDATVEVDAQAVEEVAAHRNTRSKKTDVQAKQLVKDFVAKELPKLKVAKVIDHPTPEKHPAEKNDLPVKVVMSIENDEVTAAYLEPKHEFIGALKHLIGHVTQMFDKLDAADRDNSISALVNEADAMVEKAQDKHDRFIPDEGLLIAAAMLVLSNPECPIVGADDVAGDWKITSDAVCAHGMEHPDVLSADIEGLLPFVLGTECKQRMFPVHCTAFYLLFFSKNRSWNGATSDKLKNDCLALIKDRTKGMRVDDEREIRKVWETAKMLDAPPKNQDVFEVVKCFRIKWEFDVIECLNQKSKRKRSGSQTGGEVDGEEEDTTTVTKKRGRRRKKSASS